MEMLIEPPRQTKQENKEHEEGKGCAVLIEGRYITDLDGFSAGCLHLNSVGMDDLFLAPTRVPFLQPDRVRADADENAVMEIDTITLEVVGELLTVVSRCQTAPR